LSFLVAEIILGSSKYTISIFPVQTDGLSGILPLSYSKRKRAEETHW